MAPKIIIANTFKRSGGRLTSDRALTLKANSWPEANRIILAEAKAPTACGIVMDLDKDGIMSTKFSIVGPIEREPRVRANNIWRLANEDLRLRLSIPNMSVFKFNIMDGSSRNFSEWQDALLNCSPRWYKGEEVQDWEAVVEEFPEVETGVMVRAYVSLTKDIDIVNIGIQCIPADQELLEEFRNKDLDFNCWSMPAFRIPIGTSQTIKTIDYKEISSNGCEGN